MLINYFHVTKLSIGVGLKKEKESGVEIEI